MTCDRCAELISSDIDGELTESEKSDIHMHLDDCPECRELYEMMHKHDSLLSANAVAEQPKDLRSRIRERINLARPARRGAVWHVGHLPERPSFPLKTSDKKTSPGPLMGPWGRA